MTQTIEEKQKKLEEANTYVVYRGKTYVATTLNENTFRLFSLVSLEGFYPREHLEGYYRDVPRKDIETAYENTVYAQYQDEECGIVSLNEDLTTLFVSSDKKLTEKSNYEAKDNRFYKMLSLNDIEVFQKRIVLI